MNNQDKAQNQYPFANSPVTIYIAQQIEALKEKKTQRQIATEVGYTKPNMISMLKRGEVRVPMDKIPALAKALYVDEIHLFRLALEDYWPGRSEALRKMGSVIMSDNEKELISFYRAISGNKDWKITSDLKKRLRSVFVGYRE